MDTFIVAFIVLVAAAFVARRIFAAVKSARNANAGCGDCGCGTSGDAKTDWSKS